jgi:hypothetical protein
MATRGASQIMIVPTASRRADELVIQFKDGSTYSYSVVLEDQF